ncbi:hypothetical protein AD998_08750 [bacterium 336/3]|nr:hypothetical protein AD998_08750 [bacterium 336/3]
MKKSNIITFEKLETEENFKALQNISKAQISLVGIYGRLIFKPGDWSFILGDNNLVYDATTDVLKMTINLYGTDLSLEIEAPRGFTIYGETSLEIKKASKITYNGNIEPPDPKAQHVLVME